MISAGFKELYKNCGNEVKILVKKLEKIQTKSVKCKNQVVFLKDCKKEDVTPKGFQLPNKAREVNQKVINILKTAERALVKEQIKTLYKKIGILQNAEQDIEIDIYSRVEPNEFRWILDLLGKKIIAFHRKDMNRIERKFKRLVSKDNVQGNETPRRTGTAQRIPGYVNDEINEKGNNDKNYEGMDAEEMERGFVNLTANEFNDKEIALLQQGTNYAIKEKLNLMDTISQLAGVTKNAETIHKLVHIIDERMEENSKKDFKKSQLKDLKVLQELKTKKVIKIARADKGGKLVVIDTEEYNSKMRECISLKYKKLDKDPTKKLVAQLRLYITKELGWSSKTRDEVATLYPKAPSAYGQPKIHKEGNPLRIIISQKDTCYSQMAKYLVKKLNMVIEKPESHIKNSEQFLRKIRERNIPNSSTLISLDVVDMYSNISTVAAIEALEKKIAAIDDKVFNDSMLMSKQQCISLVSLIINNNYFIFENEVYKQEMGLAMGSPLSPILSDLVMENVELEIQRQFSNKIGEWDRFIDDTFVEWTGQKEELDEFLTCINQIDGNLKFTMETEEKNSLTFLDIKVTKMEEGISTSVYKKPTAGDGIIPFKSYNPLALKVSVARQKVQRIESYYTIKREEIRAKRELRQVLVRKGYPEKIIKKIFHHKNTQKRNTNCQKDKSATKTDKIYIPIQFDEKLESKFPSILCNDKLGIAWKQRTKTLDIYKKSKLPTKNQNLKGVIYIIPCSCGKIYIGETGRPFHVRLKEHMANVRLQRNQSKLQLHLEKNEGHEIMWDGSFILETEANDRIRKLKEGILIELNKGQCISDKTIELQKNWEWVLEKYKTKQKYFGTELFTTNT